VSFLPQIIQVGTCILGKSLAIFPAKRIPSERSPAPA
jgi:hypothetical protein